MSHITVDTTAVQFTQGVSAEDLALLQQVGQLIAQQHGGEIKDFYLDFGGKPQRDCLFGIHIPGLRRGIGVKLDETNSLTFVGDSWMVKPMYAQIQQEFTQGYVTASYTQAMAAIGYDVNIVQGVEEGQYLVQGVQYV